MSIQTEKFIEAVAPIARNEYLSREKWVLPSICIAQAGLESGWNLKAKTLFGIKGDGEKSTTSEYLHGHWERIKASFISYPTVASSIVGYYDFLAKTPRFAKVINNPSYKDAVFHLIKTADGKPYATDPDYVSKVVSIIEKYNLTIYDSTSHDDKPALRTNQEVAKECIRGLWGSGKEREHRLTQAGYSYVTIQQLVNKML